MAPGPQWTEAEARTETRRMLDLLADGRPTEDEPDPLEYAQHNGLLLLIGPAEEPRLTPLFARMPPDMAGAWREALRGGSAVEAFGPSGDRGALDEDRVDYDLDTGRKNRRTLTMLGLGALVIVALVAAIVAVVRGGGGGSAGTGQIRFDTATTVPGQEQRDGPPPAVEKTLVARLDRPVAVRAGTGDVQNRLVLDPPATDLPAAAGVVAATLFRYNGRGQVVLVGPAGWLTHACLQVSVVSTGLRPFDTAYYEAAPGACGGHVFGRTAVVGCLGADTVMLDLVIPQGQVSLAEGGTAAVGAVRVLLVGNAAGYDKISLNGEISVASGAQVAVPSFGGAAGTAVRFDVSQATGAPLVGSCTLR